jgi:hypothetical protein
MFMTSLAAQAPARTEIQDKLAAGKLLGRHPLTLQWIAFGNTKGDVTISDENGLYRIKGEHKGKDGDFLTVDGVVTSITAKNFGFQGRIVTRVSHINGGKECVREGKYSFIIAGARQYWRMLQIDNPCDQAADYVDIFFAKQ